MFSVEAGHSLELERARLDWHRTSEFLKEYFCSFNVPIFEGTFRQEAVELSHRV
jgi:hypothetical protein